MSTWNVILLQITAVALGIAEAVIPSFGLLGLAGVGVLALSWYFLLVHFPIETQVIFGIVNAISLPFIIWFSFVALKRSPLNLSEQLHRGDGQVHKEKDLLHRKGVVHTPLNPTGTALFGDTLQEVQSIGGMVQPGTAVQVIEVQGNVIRVTVVPDTKESTLES
jgi:membrane-bound serine protease (ClpP class)